MAVRKECVCRNELLGNPCTAAVSLALREGGAARLHQKSNFGSHSREAASGTRPSSRAPPSPSPLRWAITSSQQRCFDRAVLWCQHRGAGTAGISEAAIVGGGAAGPRPGTRHHSPTALSGPPRLTQLRPLWAPAWHLQKSLWNLLILPERS